MAPDRTDDDAVTEMDVGIDALSAVESTITAITKPGEALENEAALPADSEPSTLEPTVGVRGLGGSGEVESIGDDDDEESATLKVDSRLLNGFAEVRAAPPISHLPSTSTAPKRPFITPQLTPSEPFRLSSPDLDVARLALGASVARAPSLSEPTLTDEHTDDTVQRRSPAAEAASKDEEGEEIDVAEDEGEDEEERTVTNAKDVIDQAAIAAAMPADDPDDEVPTSVRLEGAVRLSSNELVTDPGSSTDEANKVAARAAAMALMPTEPVSFPISKRLLVDVPPAPHAPPVPPAPPPVPTSQGSVKIAASTTGSTPIAHGDLPAQRQVRPRQDPTVPVPHRRGSRVGYIVVPAAIVFALAAAFLAREPIKSALFDPPTSPVAAAAPVEVPSAGASSSSSPASSASSADAPASSSSASADAKPRGTAPRKPAPALLRPATKPPPAPGAPGAPKASSATPLHI